MNVPRDNLNIEPESEQVVLSLRRERKLLPLLETRAWERAVPPPVTAEDLRIAWRRMVADLRDQDAMDDFGLKFHAFINQ